MAAPEKGGWGEMVKLLKAIRDQQATAGGQYDNNSTQTRAAVKVDNRKDASPAI